MCFFVSPPPPHSHPFFLYIFFLFIFYSSSSDILSFFLLSYPSFTLPLSNLHPFSLSLCLSLFSQLLSPPPTIYPLPVLFPCLFISTRKLQYTERTDEILFSSEIRKCDRLFARRLCSGIIKHAYTFSGCCGSHSG